MIPLNINVVHYIFQYGSPLLFHEYPHFPPSIHTQTHIFRLRLNARLGLTPLPSSVSITLCLSSLLTKVYLFLKQIQIIK